MDVNDKTIAEEILFQLKSTKAYSETVYSYSKLITKELLGNNSDVPCEESKWAEGLLCEILHYVTDIRDNLADTAEIQSELVHNITTSTKN